jgi:hypothetical protein
MKRLALFLVLVPALAFAKTGNSSLESKAIAAFGDIAKAKSALDQGKSKTGDSWLTKAKTLLSALLQQEPTQPTAQQQTPQPQSPQEQTPQEQSPSALSRAESAAQEVGPSLAGKLGAPAQDQGQEAPSGPSGAVSDLKSVYDKVSLAQSLLHKGDSTQAKSVLDEIPTSPADALKLLHH